MPESVHFDEKLNVLRVRSWGDVTIEDWNHSKARIIELYNETGVSEVLVDVTEQTSAPSTLDIFDFGSEWPSRIRAAIVMGDATREDQEFLENVAVNRARSMRTFDAMDKALRWLRKGSEEGLSQARA